MLRKILEVGIAGMGFKRESLFVFDVPVVFDQERDILASVTVLALYERDLVEQVARRRSQVICEVLDYLFVLNFL